jgi:hypothetical protein
VPCVSAQADLRRELDRSVSSYDVYVYICVLILRTYAVSAKADLRRELDRSELERASKSRELDQTQQLLQVFNLLALLVQKYKY